MLRKPSFTPLLGAVVLLASLLTAAPRTANAGCGCSKPPPKPATLIPAVAFPGMPVTLFSSHFALGQTWSVKFTSGPASATVTAPVVKKRAITDPTGQTYSLQLVVTVPDIPPGPASIHASYGSVSVNVSNSGFVVLGKPVAAAEVNGENDVLGYGMAVGTNGTFYVGIAGLASVCKPIEIDSYFPNYPLRFGFGEITITNSQGYLIDVLTTQSAGHVTLTPGEAPSSDVLSYFRHSFETYCHNHLPGGTKQVDPLDSNWHRDGTPHVDYSTLFFAITGHFDDGSTPAPGAVFADTVLENTLGNGTENWAAEAPEEGAD